MLFTSIISQEHIVIFKFKQQVKGPRGCTAQFHICCNRLKYWVKDSKGCSLHPRRITASNIKTAKGYLCLCSLPHGSRLQHGIFWPTLKSRCLVLRTCKTTYSCPSQITHTETSMRAQKPTCTHTDTHMHSHTVFVVWLTVIISKCSI